MCGICGIVGPGADRSDSEAVVRRMMDAFRHRGPDGDGVACGNSFVFGHKRLAIIDLERGAQPMRSDDGHITLTFNGEIYNYRERRAALLERGVRFHTNSDTETLLRLYETYGTDCLQYLRGMFSFAIFDRREGRAFIVRDRLGIKPLYYWTGNGDLVFASEIKAILEYDRVARDPYWPAIDAYLSRRYSPGPATMFEGIYKLPAGYSMTWKQGGVTTEPYWEPAIGSDACRTDDEYYERFTELFTESVRQRLISDVPLGAYLSGGLDSSCIVAAMAQASAGPVKTFSVGFGHSNDELSWAADIAGELQTDHHEIQCKADHLELLPKIVWNSDEPLGDPIVIPSFLLAQEASKTVKVVLTGEGADETMAGYLFHKVIYLAARYRQFVPRLVRDRLIRPALRALPVSLIDRVFDYPAYLGAQGKQKVVDYLDLIDRGTFADQYYYLIALFDDPLKHDLYSPGFKPDLSRAVPGAVRSRGETAILDEILKVQYADWLPDNILCRLDKMTMAHGLEGRVPFLDHELVEFLFTVPPHLKLSRLMTNKYLLRRYGREVLPKRFAQRPKKPFYIPSEDYIRHPSFKRLVDETLNPDAVKKRGYFRPERVTALVGNLRRSEFLGVKQVLSLVMLELWHRIYIDRTLSV